MPWRQPEFRPRRSKPASSRPNSGSRGYGSAAWQRVRLAVIARDRATCRSCGLVLHRAGDCQIDHINPKPVDQAAESTPLEGLQVLCRSCHSAKTRREQQGF